MTNAMRNRERYHLLKSHNLCVICGCAEAFDRPRCADCYYKKVESDRISKGCGAWREGSRGRPPKGAI